LTSDCELYIICWIYNGCTIFFPIFYILSLTYCDTLPILRESCINNRQCEAAWQYLFRLWSVNNHRKRLFVSIININANVTTKQNPVSPNTRMNAIVFVSVKFLLLNSISFNRSESSVWIMAVYALFGITSSVSKCLWTLAFSCNFDHSSYSKNYRKHIKR
jgi:hypothetical protein